MYIDDHYVLISLNVISLFTNVPLDLIIGGIAKRWHLIENKICIPYNEFLMALKLIIDSTLNLIIKFINKFLARRWDLHSPLY